MDTLQAQVLRTLMTRDGWEQYSGIVTIELVPGSETRAIYEAIRTLHTNHSGDISPSDLRLYFESAYGPSERLTVLLEEVMYVEEVEEASEAARDAAIRRFASRMYQAQAAKYIASNLASGTLDAAVSFSLCQRALDVTESVTSEVVDLSEASLPGETNDRPGICSLGVSRKLDSSLGGGVAAGELAVYLAPPSRGKTSYLCKTGAEAALAGKVVLHITLEISWRRVIRRYDCALTGKKLDQLILNPMAVSRARKRMSEAGGKVLVKDWSYTDVTPNKIKGLVKGYRSQGQRIDVVIVDYLELVQPDATQLHRREHRHVLGMLGKQTRSIAVALDCPVITAWQVNRAGLNKRTLDESDVSESWDIIKHSDIIVGLNQNPEEQREKFMRLNIIKQRDNTERPVFYVVSDLDRMRMLDRTDAAEIHCMVEEIGGEDGGKEELQPGDRSGVCGDGACADD